MVDDLRAVVRLEAREHVCCEESLRAPAVQAEDLEPVSSERFRVWTS